jgi:hypothetical protein
MLGWTSDPNGMACMTTLYQEDLAWENEACKTLFLFPSVKGPRKNPPQTISPLSPDIIYTSCLSCYGEQLKFMGNLTSCNGDRSFNETSNQNALPKPKQMSDGTSEGLCLRFSWKIGVEPVL